MMSAKLSVIFQFLMVRLKVIEFYRYICQNRISIPYGAIKSITVAETNSMFEVISIPYGAIKSYSYFLNYLFINRFQFLMVRLKV